jgi:hypothetical protein
MMKVIKADATSTRGLRNVIDGEAELLQGFDFNIRIKMELVLKRTYYPSGTNGTIYMDGVKICHSIELPWLDNKPQRSCIPEGKYELKKRWSPKYGHHYWLQDVPGRAFILIHPANNAKKELHGCIAPVLYLAGEGRGSYSRMASKPCRH